MLVRNRCFKSTEYLGRPCDARDAACPCRSCYSPHDCGYSDSRGRWVIDMRCIVRERGGCPAQLPEPNHKLATPRSRKCARCGAQPARAAAPAEILGLDKSGGA